MDRQPEQDGYRVELTPRHDPGWSAPLLYVYLAVAPLYLIWRFTVVNWGIWFGPATYFAEVFGVVTTAMFLAITQKIYVPVHRKARLDATVDALIPTLNESITILVPTIRGALDVRGIRNVFVLDDGDRPEVRYIAESLGAIYVARSDGRYAKAGNMNNGLKHTDAEFILTLDADHIPVPSFLERTLGYMDDPKLAFVQTPQTYYNNDSFVFRQTRRRLWSEQSMFYDIIQLAKNRWNSSFYVGTSALLRRAALDEVGGFATGTATEDIHTSLRLHAKGWRSLLLPEALAFGLEAENLKEYYRQRRRWAAGSLGLLFRSEDSPVVARGLTVAQRINYVSATFAHLQGVQKLYYFLLPLLCIFTLTNPVSADLTLVVPVIVGFVCLSVLVTSVYARGTYHPIHTEAYNLSHCLAHLAGLWGILRIQRKFSVSLKKPNPAQPTWLKSFYWTLVGLVGLGAARAVELLLTPMPAPDVRLLTICLAIGLANLVVLMSFLGSLERYEYRHRRSTTGPNRSWPWFLPWAVPSNGSSPGLFGLEEMRDDVGTLGLASAVSSHREEVLTS